MTLNGITWRCVSPSQKLYDAAAVRSPHTSLQWDKENQGKAKTVAWDETS